MSFVSERSKATPQSMIREIFAMQEGIDDVISFALGEPDFITPQHIIDAAVKSFQRGETHYTPNAGIAPLREAVAEDYRKRGLSYAPDEIVIGAGAISILSLACATILDIGDEVLLPDPGWVNYVGTVAQAGAVPVLVKTRESNHFMFDIDDLRAAVTSKTKMILLNFPANPTGAVATEENLRQIADLVCEKKLYVLTDEIYHGLLWDGKIYTSIASFPGMKERTLIVDGFSKKYAMTGFRLGYGAGPQEVISAMIKQLEYVLSSVNEGIQWGGVAALTGSQDCVDAMNELYRRRRKIVVDGLNSIDAVSCLKPAGTFFAFANISKTGLSSRDFAIRLLQKEHVAVVPGTGFGEGGEGYIRLSYAIDEEKIKKGLLRIERFVKELT